MKKQTTAQTIKESVRAIKFCTGGIANWSNNSRKQYGKNHSFNRQVLSAYQIPDT
jgi:hypothetical protein